MKQKTRNNNNKKDLQVVGMLYMRFKGFNRIFKRRFVGNFFLPHLNQMNFSFSSLCRGILGGANKKSDRLCYMKYKSDKRDGQVKGQVT